jgi:hypothetical protein|tara:strand:- start:77 stop:433 length:357 start_codon:yes stop_codon:yes gene_type:complete
MANTITAKRISAKEQNSARVTLHIDTSGATDSDLFEFTLETGEIKRFVPNRIDAVINMGPNDISFNEKVFETGNWVMSQFGGLPMTVVGAGSSAVLHKTINAIGTAPNVIVEMRGFIR